MDLKASGLAMDGGSFSKDLLEFGNAVEWSNPDRCWRRHCRARCRQFALLNDERILQNCMIKNRGPNDFILDLDKGVV
jgi:hypothetical protein